MVLGKIECPGSQTIPRFSYPESPHPGLQPLTGRRPKSPEDTPYSYPALGRCQSVCKQGGAEARRAVILTGAAKQWVAEVS